VPRDRDLLVGSLLAVIAAACFGTLGPMSRFAEDAGIGSLGFVAWRAGIGASLLIAVVAIARRDVGSIARLDARGRLALAVAVVSGAALNIAIFLAFGRITIALALVLFYTYPAMVAAVGMALGHEPLTRLRLAALVLASLGVILVLVGGLEAGTGVTLDPLGVGLALLAAVCQTIFIVVSRRAYHSVPSDVATMVILVGGASAAVAVAVASGSAADLAGPLAAPAGWPIVLAAGLLGAALPSLLFLSAIRRIGGVRTGILMLFEPVVGVVLAAVLLAEPFRSVQLLGGLLVLLAAALVQLGPTPEAPVPEDTAPVA
jgi:drug/metabolite transporter (DMT)-like permease